MIRPFTVLNLVMAAAFVLAAAVQYNDPDPWRWIAVYASAAACCFLKRSTRAARALPAVVGVIALVGFVMLLPRFAGQVGVGDLFASLKMKTQVVEWGREGLGLALIALWMAVLTVRAFRSDAR